MHGDMFGHHKRPEGAKVQIQDTVLIHISVDAEDGDFTFVGDSGHGIDDRDILILGTVVFG